MNQEGTLCLAMMLEDPLNRCATHSCTNVLRPIPVIIEILATNGVAQPQMRATAPQWNNIDLRLSTLRRRTILTQLPVTRLHQCQIDILRQDITEPTLNHHPVGRHSRTSHQID